MPSKYFNREPQGQINEQELREDLAAESIHTQGHSCYFIPREHKEGFSNVDYLYGEDRLRTFDEAYLIDTYIVNVDSWEGEGDIISRFGLQLADRVRLAFARKTFREVVTCNKPEVQYPREGDLIFLPVVNYLFEINFTEPEQIFFELGKNYIYECDAEAFSFSHEKLDTGVPEVDNIAIEFENIADANNDPFSRNDELEAEADNYQNFDESNPFGDL